MIKNKRTLKNNWYKGYTIVVLSRNNLYEFYCSKDNEPFEFIYAESCNDSWTCLSKKYISDYDSDRLFSYITESYNNIMED